MVGLALKAAHWWRALGVRERQAACASLPLLDELTADRRLHRWRVLFPFLDEQAPHAISVIHGLTPDVLMAIPDEPPADLARPAASWFEELEGVWWDTPPHGPQGSELGGLLNLAAPWINRARTRLEAELARVLDGTSDALDASSCIGFATNALPELLVPVIGRTLVLELHICRLRGQLEGGTPSARFRNFSERLLQPDQAVAILREYPVLARLIAEVLARWVNVSSELFARLHADWSDLAATFGRGRPAGLLEAVTWHRGDLHRGGRAVAFVRTTTGVRFVYKPRSLAIDVQVQGLLEWTNARGSHPPFATLGILDRGSYGWVEFVESRGCDSAEEVRRFYERQGAYLSLLHALAATDIHFENLIACGEHPFLVDVETLFHPSTRPTGGLLPDPATGALRASVLRVGMLPYPSFAGGLEEGIDLSALGGAAGQRPPFAVPGWQDIGTDEMRILESRPLTTERSNRPTLAGRPVDACDYRDSFVTGFEAMYRLLSDRRDELLAPDGPLARFAGAETRVVLRPTVVYASLRQASYHPDALRDAIDRDALFGWLWVSTPEHRPLDTVVAAEARELRDGDIPRFATRPESRDIITRDGSCIADALDESGMMMVRRKLEAFNEVDLERQSWIVRATLTPELPNPAARRIRVATDAATPAPSELIEGAVRIGERLARAVVRDGGRVSWIARTRHGVGRLTITPVGAALYDGLAGIALFCAHLGESTGRAEFASLARDALDTARDLSTRLASCGAFDGEAGLVYVLAHLGHLWSEGALFDEARQRSIGVIRRALDERAFDVIGGAAGCLAALLALHAVQPSDELLNDAIAIGDRIVRDSVRTSRGCAWASPIASSAPLTGFGHGAAGIGWALAELFPWSLVPAHRRAALDAFAYEHSLYSHEQHNWPDLRRVRDATEQRFGLAWCHGAPGILLARLCAARRLDAPHLVAEAGDALHHLDATFGWGHGLCHGDLGNLETLREAAAFHATPEWRERHRQHLSRTLRSGLHNGWLLDGSDGGFEAPGLMTGLAGIGWGLLRAVAPDVVPCVLRLAPPVESRGAADRASVE